MPDASESSIVSLSEMALVSALKAGLTFSKLGVNLKLTVNIPVNALEKIAVADIVREYQPQAKKWAGLIIDVPEEQIVTDLALASDLAARLERCNVRLAIDDFGRGTSSLARLGEMPFAELKLDRTFVADCGTDKVNAPLCKTVIDLAHNFGKVAVAIGHRKGGRRGGPGQHGLRFRSGLPARPTDAGRALHFAAAPAGRRQRPHACRRSRAIAALNSASNRRSQSADKRRSRAAISGSRRRGA